MPVCSNRQLFLDHFYTIENVLLENPNSNIILLGDYNLSSATFCNFKDFLYEQILNLNLPQCNYIININGTTLDKVISKHYNILINENVYLIRKIDNYYTHL